MTAGLDAAVASASLWAGLSVCAAAPPPAIEITFVNNPPVESSALSRKQLAKMPSDTQFSHQREEGFSVNGITVDETTPKYQVDYEVTSDTQTTTVCLRVDHVAITIEYSPRIYIASEYRAGSCRYDQTLNHEFRHVDTQVITINEFLPQLKRAVEGAVGAAGVAELRDPADAEPVKAALMEAIRHALVENVAEMHKVALLRQKQIDTRHEYLRLTRACP